MLYVSTHVVSVWTPFAVEKTKIEPNSWLCELGLQIGFFFQKEEIGVFSR